MSKQKIAPVLSDDEMRQIFSDHAIAFYSYFIPLVRAIEQAVLARVGAVRDQALEEAATSAWSSLMDICKRWALAPSGSNGKWFAVCDAIRALKVTPAAAVADAQPSDADIINVCNTVYTADHQGEPCGYEIAIARAILARFGRAAPQAVPQAGQLSRNAGQVADAQPGSDL